ncbi:malate synthase A [Bacillus sp. RG28]|uniref:Malate synthase n=1 Tax=Gottfriedia endophytica TaxID=2820819 RepID=A0A940NTE9_9BACI|nr:malate synthase A [Gottfriedia endophytica]MBP0724543.1 malate synthase A [Gottfriedia endophytica]
MAIDLSDIKIIGNSLEGGNEILTKEALLFLGKLHSQFEDRRQALLLNRKERMDKLKNGESLHFLDETKDVREGEWTIGPLPSDLQNRRVEITGPVDRKMVINALNSDAFVFMADFEDATSPTWENIMNGQINLRDAVNRTISFSSNGKTYHLKDKTATLVVRPRGWHLNEKHILVNGQQMSGSLVDFGLYFFHNVNQLLTNGSGPYFYLPKMESYLEARFWNDVFIFAQEYLNIPRGTIKATVLIETIAAAFEMEEILFELREHSAGFNCGRWDYIFSVIKMLRYDKKCILPDRSEVTMESPFMRAYSQKVIQVCHRRNAPAIGGMAAQIPIKGDEEKNAAAFSKVRLDKEREARDGHDGTWVAHPGLVPVALNVFDELMLTPNQIHVKRDDVNVKEENLLELPIGKITEQGLRTNITVAIQYIEAWLGGKGAVPLYNLMEDAATAEISRAQIWQWIRHEKGVLENGEKITLNLVHTLKNEEMNKLQHEIGMERYNSGRFSEAITLFDHLIEEDDFEDFLTLKGYDYL